MVKFSSLKKKKKKVSRGIRRMGFGLIVLGVHIFWNYEQRFIQKKKCKKKKEKTTRKYDKTKENCDEAPTKFGITELDLSCVHRKKRQQAPLDVVLVDITMQCQSNHAIICTLIATVNNFTVARRHLS
jgi:hypothetical protein